MFWRGQDYITNSGRDPGGGGLYEYSSDGKWNVYSNNCADACMRVLKQIQAGVSGGTPDALWRSIIAKYRKSSTRQLGTPLDGGIRGKEFGTPRQGVDPFFFIPHIALHCETTTVTISQNGNGISSTSTTQNCHR